MNRRIESETMARHQKSQKLRLRYNGEEAQNAPSQMPKAHKTGTHPTLTRPLNVKTDLKKKKQYKSKPSTVENTC